MVGLKTLYFSYSRSTLPLEGSPEPINSPYSITWHVERLLQSLASERGYTYRYVNLDDITPQSFTADDIVIGHVWHEPQSFMRQALASVATVFTLQPYSHGMVSHNDIPQYLDLFLQAKHNFWITGEYWFDTMPQSPFAPLAAQSTRLDMAVNCEVHPYSKRKWNKAGKRAFLCMGSDIPAKGLDCVAELARVAGFKLGHCGYLQTDVFQHVPQIKLHGGVVFYTDAIQAMCDEYDALIALGRYDANPTVLLEASAWGLTVFCNKESGYWSSQPFREVRLGDMRHNLDIVTKYQEQPEYELVQESTRMRLHIEQEYNWNKFLTTLRDGLLEYIP